MVSWTWYVFMFQGDMWIVRYMRDVKWCLFWRSENIYERAVTGKFGPNSERDQEIFAWTRTARSLEVNLLCMLFA